LTDYTLGLYASRDYLKRHAAPAAAAGLAAHRLVGYVEDLIYAPDLNFARDFLRGWRSTIEISSAVGQFEAVRSGAGIGILHDYLARPERDLVPVLPKLRATRSYWLAIHESLYDMPRVRAAADFVTEAVRRDHDGFNGA
jgi:DNA-binding transcriptional LysR family regulator